MNKKSRRGPWPVLTAVIVLAGGFAAAAWFQSNRTEPVASADAAPAASGVSFAPASVAPPAPPSPALPR